MRGPLSKKIALLFGALAISLLAAELLLRATAGPRRPLGHLSYRDAAGHEFTELGAAIAAGLIEPLDAALTPRPRYRFAPGARGFLCYSDQDRLHRDWLDEHGCVEIRINSFGLREREEIRPDNKRDGEYRIVCIGDSFTFGWGIPVELGWVRLLENELRRGGRDVRTVNCGASGALVTDEYAMGLEKRFGAFQPDAVLVTLCLNDLIPSNGLCVLGHPPVRPSGCLLLDLARNALAGDALALDPKIDWVDLLLHLPREQSDAAGMTGPDAPYEAMWSQGTPQSSLKQMRDWCEDRRIPFLVVLWPFLQGLGPGESYPFEKLHRLVASFCAEERIPFHDVLSSLKGHAASTLWVTPADLHPNPLAQTLATQGLTSFVRKECAL
ncbi:MAG: hypothetical protein Fur0037_00190 [Planctomycetota bacterium]